MLAGTARATGHAARSRGSKHQQAGKSGLEPGWRAGCAAHGRAQIGRAGPRPRSSARRAPPPRLSPPPAHLQLGAAAAKAQHHHVGLGAVGVPLHSLQHTRCGGQGDREGRCGRMGAAQGGPAGGTAGCQRQRAALVSRAMVSNPEGQRAARSRAAAQDSRWQGASGSERASSRRLTEARHRCRRGLGGAAPLACSGRADTRRRPCSEGSTLCTSRPAAVTITKWAAVQKKPSNWGSPPRRLARGGRGRQAGRCCQGQDERQHLSSRA